MSAVTIAVLLSVPACLAVIAYLLGYDNGYLRARRELRETRARRIRRGRPLLGVTRTIRRNDD